MGPCGALSQQQRFWALKFLWNLLGTYSSEATTGWMAQPSPHGVLLPWHGAGGSGPAGVTWRYSATQYGSLRITFHVSAGATAWDAHWLLFHFLEIALHLQCQLPSRVILEAVAAGPASGGMRRWPLDYFSLPTSPPGPRLSPALCLLTHHP